MIDQVTAKWEGGVVTLRPKEGGPEIIRTACFVFEVPGGFGWLEPAYANPMGSPSPTWHEVLVSQIAAQGSTLIAFDGPLFSGDIEQYFGQTEAAQAMEWFAGWLKENGRTFQEERARVIAEGLVPLP